MPITRVRIIDPQYRFEELPGYVAQVFPDSSLAFGVLFPEAMVSGRYSLDDLEVDGFISHDEFDGCPIDLTAERLNILWRQRKTAPAGFRSSGPRLPPD
jgi:hypothetical protein